MQTRSGAKEAKEIHAEWWKRRIARQKAIDASISAKADFEYLYDKPYEDNKKVRVAGPFTVESLSPHRVISVDENGEWIDGQPKSKSGRKDEADFVQMILENLKTAGVQQAHKEDKISFSSIAPWPGYFVCAEGKYFEGDEQIRETSGDLHWSRVWNCFATRFGCCGPRSGRRRI